MVNTELILREACRLAELDLAEQDCARVSNMPDIETSKRFDRRVNKIIRRMKTGKYKNTKKAARVLILVAALIAVFSINATGVNPLQEKVRNFFVNTFNAGSLIQFEDDNSTRGTLYSEYTWVPEGYELLEKDSKETYERIVYKGNAGDEIISVSRKNDSSILSVDTENMKFEEIVINNSSAMYYADDESSQIIWSKGNYNYRITVSSSVAKDELIKMAESRENVY